MRPPLFMSVHKDRNKTKTSFPKMATMLVYIRSSHRIRLLLTVVCCVLQVWGSSRAQESVMDKSSSSLYSSLSPTIFAPGGRLFSVERTLLAVKEDHPFNNLVIAIKCRNAMVVVTSEVTSPYLSSAMTNATSKLDAAVASPDDSFPSLLLPDTGVARPPFCRLATDLWGVTAGRATDAQLLRLQLHGVAETVRYRQGAEDDGLARPAVLARSLADRRQRATQQSSNDDDDDDGSDYGLLNATALIFHRDDLWRVEPSGQFFACQAAVVGRKADVAEQDLTRRLTELIRMTTNNNNGTSRETTDGHERQDSSDQTPPVETDPIILREFLSQMTPEEALKVAKECIRGTLEQRVPSSSSSSSSSSSKPIVPSMRAFCLTRDTAKWFANEDL